MKRTKLQLIIKRYFDIVISIFVLIIGSPFFLLISLLILVTSKGGIFFLQERLGHRGKIFKIIKFRTMVKDAEHLGSGLVVRDESDPRITKIGKFLRNTSLDEIPQVLNVLIGDMSIVGPRPPVIYHPYKYHEYDKFKKKRFLMRPGITGLAQVKVRNSATWDERIVMDVKYVQNFSLWLDFKILLETVFSLIHKETYVE